MDEPAAFASTPDLRPAVFLNICYPDSGRIAPEGYLGEVAAGSKTCIGGPAGPMSDVIAPARRQGKRTSGSSWC